MLCITIMPICAIHLSLPVSLREAFIQLMSFPVTTIVNCILPYTFSIIFNISKPVPRMAATGSPLGRTVVAVARLARNGSQAAVRTAVWADSWVSAPALPAALACAVATPALAAPHCAAPHQAPFAFVIEIEPATGGDPRGAGAVAARRAVYGAAQWHSHRPCHRYQHRHQRQYYHGRQEHRKVKMGSRYHSNAALAFGSVP